MFNVYGDDIVLESVKIGELKGGWPGLRDRAVNYLEGMIDDYVSEEDHRQQVEEASDEAYKEGEANQKSRMGKEIDDAEEKGFSEGKIAGIKEGWNSALKESAHAAETERVALLLTSCNKIYALLGAGLRERKAKDARDKMRAALLELSNAARAYKS